MFGVVKHNNKEKWVYSGYGIAFDEKGNWKFGNDFTRNVVIFGVDNSSSPHEEKFSINFRKSKTKFCVSLYYNGDNNYLFVNRKKSFKFKHNNRKIKF